MMMSVNYLFNETSEIYLFILKVFNLFIFIVFNLFIFRERGREGEREGEKYQWLPLTCSLLGTWLATQACAD